MCIIEISYLRQREFRRKETHEKKATTTDTKQISLTTETWNFWNAHDYKRANKMFLFYKYGWLVCNSILILEIIQWLRTEYNPPYFVVLYNIGPLLLYDCEILLAFIWTQKKTARFSVTSIRKIGRTLALYFFFLFVWAILFRRPKMSHILINNLLIYSYMF